MKRILIIVFVIYISLPLAAQITMEKGKEGLLFLEKGKKVMFYQIVPKSHNGQFERCHYFHPVWGLDGNIISEDFPADHLHHRGIFWAWHQLWIDGKRIGDTWALKNFEQKVTDTHFSNSGKAGVLRTEVDWKSDNWIKDGQKVPFLKETSTITIHPEKRKYRRIDFEISLLALEKNLTIGGSEDEKGYSGFSVRVILPEDILFSGPSGVVEPKLTAVESTGYINISGSMGAGGKKAGVVVLDHPENPGYPQPWILRSQKSMQNAAFPGNKVVEIPTDKPMVLKYSVLVYKGLMQDKQIKKIK
ncbi:MAG: PmoA family protein [Prolixibacteraceae bacterium]|nr:PmoA family protein [Prolixibacteraceae bacterium]